MIEILDDPPAEDNPPAEDDPDVSVDGVVGEIGISNILCFFGLQMVDPFKKPLQATTSSCSGFLKGPTFEGTA